MISEPQTALEIAAQWSGIATAIAAVLGLVLAGCQIRASRRVAKESTATNLYNHCIGLSLQYPRLAEPALSGGFAKLVSDAQDGSSYGWYVASLLLSCEEILEVTDNNREWRASIIASLDGHADYFRYRNENRPLGSYYSKQLMSVIDEIMLNSDNPPEAQAIRMTRLTNA